MICWAPGSLAWTVFGRGSLRVFHFGFGRGSGGGGGRRTPAPEAHGGREGQRTHLLGRHVGAFREGKRQGKKRTRVVRLKNLPLSTGHQS